MQHTATAPTLEEFVELQKLHQTVQATFQTEDSLKWFVRRHRPELVGAGALIIIAGRMRFHPDIFQKTAVKIGRKQGAK